MRFLLLLLCVAGCSSPSPRFAGIPAQRLEVEGHLFDVYARPDEAQVLRLNTTWLPDSAEVIAAGVLAAERVTGCDAILRKGNVDAAIMTFPLKCR